MSIKQTGNPEEAFFACAPEYLDIYTLSYRWFGAVWTLDTQGGRLVRGYWFGDGVEEVLGQAKHAGWQSIAEGGTEGDIRQIYEAVRRKQQVSDWNKRSCLPLRSSLSKPWRTVKSGWYAFRSRDQFPLYVASLQKKGWLVYVEHADVCENETELRNFIEKVNKEHRIQLQDI
jgi:hypothetical protein